MKLPRSRRDFLSASIAAPLALSLAAGCSSEEPAAPAEEPAAAAKHYPIGLELYSVRQALAEDLMGTVERPAPGQPASAGTVEAWQKVAGLLTEAQEAFAAAGLRAGYHNHQYEWRSFEGAAENGPRFPMDVLASGTPEGVTLQFDAGTCMEMERDPVAWITSHPGRIRSVHCKDWAPGTEEEEKGYRVLFAEGVTPWRDIFATAESVGGVEFYLLEQEGSRYDEFETARRCLATWKEMRA